MKEEGEEEDEEDEEEEDEAEKVLIQHGITKHNAAIERCDKYGSAWQEGTLRMERIG